LTEGSGGKEYNEPQVGMTSTSQQRRAVLFIMLHSCTHKGTLVIRVSVSSTRV